ncbi:MAG: DUF6702 family protein [Cyclobacteriaceae bacterium]
MIKLLILSGLLSINDSHDFKLAHYQLSKTENKIELFIRLDRFDLLSAVSVCSQKEELATCMTSYLQQHFSLSLNGVKADFEYRSHEIKKDFIEMNYSLGEFDKEVKEIRVYNDVLLELYDGQENIIVSLLHGRKRSFRLNKGRFETTIKY